MHNEGDHADAAAKRIRDDPEGTLGRGVDVLLYLLADAVERNAQGLQSLGGNAFTFMDKTQEDVFGTNVIVVQHACLFLGKHNYATGTVRKSLKHFATLLAAPIP